MDKSDKGFSLIKILAIIAVAGILAVLAVFFLHSARQTARDAIRIADITQIRDALELYFYNCNNYPVAVAAGQSINGADCGGQVYMQSVPVDPSGQDYAYLPCSDQETKNCSQDVKNAQSYQLYYSLEADTGGISRGNHLATPWNLY